MSYLTRTDNDKSMTSWDDFFNGFFDNMGTYNRKTPFVDVKENDAEFELQADLPGFTEKDVNLKLENHVLVISSKHEEEKNEDKGEFYEKNINCCCFVDVSFLFIVGMYDTKSVR